ncbi:MAG TPA: haloacid dehalogenase-like hydrolase, partial [Xanthobacteraceae bacterium]|nr:haloacid dehalogenase-like hydrolase [Xanthobacteraceae bacterium]
AWREVEEEWKAGKIGSRECLAKQTALIDAAPEEIDFLIDEIEIDPGFGEFMRTCRRLGAGVTIVSDGYRRSIERVLAKGGYDIPAHAGTLEYRGGRRWALASPNADPRCTSDSNTCKCKVASESKLPTVLIGDGRSDFCVAGEVDFVLAKGSLARHCAENKIKYRLFGDLAGAAKLLAEYLDKIDTKRAA